MRAELTQEERDRLAEFNKKYDTGPNKYVSEEALLEVINFVDSMEILDEDRAAIFNGTI
jgi:hypothetical protein